MIHGVILRVLTGHPNVDASMPAPALQVFRIDQGFILTDPADDRTMPTLVQGPKTHRTAPMGWTRHLMHQLLDEPTFVSPSPRSRARMARKSPTSSTYLVKSTNQAVDKVLVPPGHRVFEWQLENSDKWQQQQHQGSTALNCHVFVTAHANHIRNEHLPRAS